MWSGIPPAAFRFIPQRRPPCSASPPFQSRLQFGAYVTPFSIAIGSGIDMTRFGKDRMALVPCAQPVPTVNELEKRFIAFWTSMRGNLYDSRRRGQLAHSEVSRAKKLAGKAYERRCREAGLGSVADKELPTLLKLIAEGGHLLGPSTEDEVLRLIAALHKESPWMREVSVWIMKQMLQQVAAGTCGFAMPPVILSGPPGIGKSHFARSLANLAGLPVRMIDVGAGSAGFRISGTEKGWGTAQPGIPVETLIAHRVANPIMIVDEVDKSGTVYSTKGTASSFTTSMLQMLEPGTAQRFECPYYRVPIDMSRVIWIMTANEIKHVPTPLRDRSRVFNLPPLSAEDAITYFGRLTPDCEKDEAWHRCCEFIASRCNRSGGISLRQIRQLAGVLEAPVQNMMH